MEFELGELQRLLENVTQFKALENGRFYLNRREVLTTPWLRQVLATLVAFGAPEEILVEARPHIGTDRLRLLLTRFRAGLQRLGVELRYQARLTDLEADGTQVTAGIVNKLLHLPTVRLKEAAAGAEGPAYADAVRHLFGLDDVTEDARS